MREFSKKTLARYDGKTGTPAYIAYAGKVYGVSNRVRWRERSHQFRHRAGQDLAGSLSLSSHCKDMLERVSVIGRMEEG
ncbi:MAG: cytochrome B5 [Deltaproteobacteria bacterium]|nr:MAG: cytochrome B5 [Deltaproteobacteria bacterium]UCH07482.1 MAG: cytochrome B5 [Deltaproteobacteria bacterium]